MLFAADTGQFTVVLQVIIIVDDVVVDGVDVYVGGQHH